VLITIYLFHQLDFVKPSREQKSNRRANFLGQFKFAHFIQKTQNNPKFSEKSSFFGFLSKNAIF